MARSACACCVAALSPDPGVTGAPGTDVPFELLTDEQAAIIKAMANNIKICFKEWFMVALYARQLSLPGQYGIIATVSGYPEAVRGER